MDIPPVSLSTPLPPSMVTEPPRESFDDVLARQFERFTSEIEVREVSLDAVVKQLTTGRQYSMQELLVLQVKVHQYSFELDLLSKIVQQAVQGLREVLRTQV